MEIIQTRQTTTFVNTADAELADAMRGLAWKAIEEAEFIISFGTPGERLGIIKTLLSRTASMVGAETTTRYEQMRNEFDDMMVSLRGGDDVLEDTFDLAEIIDDEI